MTDEKLMLAYAAGDYSAFETLYLRHSGRVYAYLRKRLTRSEETDEVFQKVFLKVHQSRHKYDAAYPLTQWLFVIVKTSLLDHFRKQGRQVQTSNLEEYGDVFPDQLSQTKEEPAFNGKNELSILKGLPPEQRQALEMRVIDEKSYEEIAGKLKKTQESVRQLVSRALRKLKVEL